MSGKWTEIGPSIVWDAVTVAMSPGKRFPFTDGLLDKIGSLHL